MSRLLMGSVAEHVVRSAPCPVLVVRPREHEFILPEPMGPTGGNLPHGQDAGFLGKAYDPFVLSADPSKKVKHGLSGGTLLPTNVAKRKRWCSNSSPRVVCELFFKKPEFLWPRSRAFLA